MWNEFVEWLSNIGPISFVIFGGLIIAAFFLAVILKWDQRKHRRWGDR